MWARFCAYIQVIIIIMFFSPHVSYHNNLLIPIYTVILMHNVIFDNGTHLQHVKNMAVCNT